MDLSFTISKEGAPAIFAVSGVTYTKTYKDEEGKIPDHVDAWEFSNNQDALTSLLRDMADHTVDGWTIEAVDGENPS